MPTLEEKIDSIYTILQKQEARYKRAFWFRVIYRALIFGIILFAFLYPQKIVEGLYIVLKPIIASVVSDVITSQKEAINTKSEAILEQMKHLYNGK